MIKKSSCLQAKKNLLDILAMDLELFKLILYLKAVVLNLSCTSNDPVEY
jgi:hypothetical protein